jgi:hypothetical protein
MNYTYRITPGTLLPMVATLPFLRGDDPVTVEAVISGTTGDLHVEVSAIGLGASYLHSCQTFADAGAMADACIEQLVADYGLEPRATVAPRARWCPDCGLLSPGGLTCATCRTALAEISSSLRASAIEQIAAHNETHAATWAGRVAYAIRTGRADDARGYGAAAGRHGRVAARYRAALELCRMEVAS